MSEISAELVTKVAEAIDSADVGHRMKLVRLVDGVCTYRVEIDDSVEEFTDDEDLAIKQAYARIRQVRQRKQAEAVIAVLSAHPTPSQNITTKSEEGQ